MPELSSMMTVTKWAIHNLLAPLWSWNRLSNKILEEMHMGWVDQLWIGTHAGGGLVVALRRRTALIWRSFAFENAHCKILSIPYRKREWVLPMLQPFLCFGNLNKPKCSSKRERGLYSNKLSCNRGLYRIQISNTWKGRFQKSIAFWLKMDFPSTQSMESGLMGIFSMHFKKWQSNAFISLYIWKVKYGKNHGIILSLNFHKSIPVAKINNQSSYILKVWVF